MQFSDPVNEFLTRPAIIPQFLSPEQCRLILDLPRSRSYQGQVSLDSGQTVELSIRRAVTHLLAESPQKDQLGDSLMRLFDLSNQRFFHFHLTSLAEPLLLQYLPDGFYDWHMDIGAGLMSTRKLSSVIFLSDPKDYEGGRLELVRPGNALPNDQGTAVVFPSYLLHRVEPVTAGERWTIAAFHHGQPFV